jgi:glyceraldehyde-3-phosphate dehydrogenase (NAD(P))
MGPKRTIHVVGTGTIGEPLIGLLLHLQEDLSVDEITFHKHSPRIEDRPKIKSLMRRGAKLAVEADRMTDFEKIGLQPTYTRAAALEQASVVVECTSDGLALQHKDDWYAKMQKTNGFIAQGSEFGFGKMYAYGINDDTLIAGEDRFLQVVSCNTHNLAVLINTLALHGEAADNLV